jgi:predicted CXXCH cytochrome family protein
VGCHTGTNTDTGTIPFVYQTTVPDYGINTLAGGNFYWATLDGTKGHNVIGIPAMAVDGILDKAPGDKIGCTLTGNCHVSLYSTAIVDTGCEGCHLAPKHHAPQQAEGTPAVAENGYFRFLSGHMNGGTGCGVEGIEDADWEYQANALNHNEYLGKANVHNGSAGFGGVLENTMTAYCTGCHGYFHDQQDASNSWIRHPSDVVIPSSGEYLGYLTYDPGIPVARPNLTGVFDTHLVSQGADMVMCLSCHRAHGSPYPDMLRFDYTNMKAGDGGDWKGTGCFKCHSEKD